MADPIEAAMKRTRGYWFVDGFTEMIAGALFLVMGGVLFLRGLSPQATVFIQLDALIREIGLIKQVGIIVAVALLWLLKDRFTYRRTGYVRGKKVTWAQIGMLIRNAVFIFLIPVVLFIGALLLVPSLRVILFAMPVWLPALIGLVLATVSIAAGRWMGLARFQWAGIGILLAALAVDAWQLTQGLPALPAMLSQTDLTLALPDILQAPVTDNINRTFSAVGMFILITGIIFLVSGLITFLRYRKENPEPYKEEA
jgi:hypothetical protein